MLVSLVARVVYLFSTDRSVSLVSDWLVVCVRRCDWQAVPMAGQVVHVDWSVDSRVLVDDLTLLASPRVPMPSPLQREK